MKRDVLDFVPWVSNRCGQPQRRVCGWLGLGWSRFQRWGRLARQGAALADRSGGSGQRVDSPLAWEVSATIEYALAHPKDGYRRLAWMMIDEDVAYLSESSVYRILSERDLLYRWARPQRHDGQIPARAAAPHERWHTDLMYLRVGDTWYFLISFLDAYSRYIVHWELLSSMTADRVALAQLAALEKFPGVSPQIVSDRGCQYTSREYKQLMRRFELEHILCRVAHPQSNGLVERWHRSTRDALYDAGGATDYRRALKAIGAWVTEYNDRRLHAGLGYMEPAEFFRGNPEARRALRKEKLVQAKEHRRAANLASAGTVVSQTGAVTETSPVAGSAPTSSVALCCPFSRSRHPGNLDQREQPEVSRSETTMRFNLN